MFLFLRLMNKIEHLINYTKHLSRKVVLFFFLLSMGATTILHAERIPHITIVLPFEAQGIEGGRSVEFVRGFLMATDVLKHKGTSATIEILTEPSSKASIVTTLQRIDPKRTDLLIAPVYPSHFADVSQFSSQHSLLTAIPFSSRIQQIETNPFLIALNAPESYRQECAANLINKTFGKEGNLVVVQTTARGEHEFTGELGKRLKASGYTTHEITAEFSPEQMKKVVVIGRQNLVIIDDASLAEMQKLMKRLASFRREYPGYSVAVIGYSDWLASKQQEVFYQQNSYILTPSFYNAFSSETQNLEAIYRTSFRVSPEDVTPRMFLLGYDFGMYALSRLTELKDFVHSSITVPHYQTEFRFERPAPGTGYVNTCMFLLHYKTDRSLDKIAIR